ncbi:Cell division control protein 45 [Neolecta irregularis DAH-3]|uniref:Cell division control protein 45 n=1 Tax=Neolecta irregularis (strain DAH-3) TaxID=1198029 RepID=A0A1U7LN09_NEOID|nr:Cell division control protein 45 [Neolecta irregularis DAH-3]|eukprot:OLL23973.1 Cell division control protein 45 [Neolecta irregularis DAH-3]
MTALPIHDKGTVSGPLISQISTDSIPTDVFSSDKGDPEVPKSALERLINIFACGSVLFSDGYLNGVIGPVNTILKTIYPQEYQNSNYSKKVSSIVFAGTVVGQLLFGYLSDKQGRRFGMLSATIILIVFSVLSAGSMGLKHSIHGMLDALTAWRFFLGIGIGAEYPAGSVACSEASSEQEEGSRHAWFVMFTNFQIDLGFVLSSLIPFILICIFSQDHLHIIWRLALGFGALPPLSVFYFRLTMKEPAAYKKGNMKNTRIPYGLVVKKYWKRLVPIATVWFLYDFSAYSFSIYSTSILQKIVPDGSLRKNFGWNTLIMTFYLPGAMCGGFAADRFGPRMVLFVGLMLQALVGFLMSGLYSHLMNNIGAFCVVYGLFLTFGEFGPGDNIGLIAAKSSPTAIRGQFYGIAAAVGKVGAFVGSFVFPDIIKRFGGPETIRGNSGPFYIGSALAVVSGLIGLFFLPNVSQQSLEEEDAEFSRYLQENNFDITTMGLQCRLDVEQAAIVERDGRLTALYIWRLMGYITRNNYAKAYQKLRPLSFQGSCSVLLFVALDVDALCACKMLARMMKRDYIPHKIHPVAGYQDLEKANRELVQDDEELKFIFMINCGALIDLVGYLQPRQGLTIYVIDSHRPWNLDNLFVEGEVVVWDDGEIEMDMKEEKEAYIELSEMPEVSSDDEENKVVQDTTRKRKSRSRSDEEESDSSINSRPRQRRKTSSASETADSFKYVENPYLALRRKRGKHQSTISTYYDRGTWYGESVSGVIYSLASELSLEDNDLLWLAIIGLTNQDLSRRGKYSHYYPLLKDEVNRLNPPPLSGERRINGRNPSDKSIKAECEFRFMMVRHWSLYDSMLHSPYLSAKLHLWSENGRKKLHKLLAKIGFSLVQCRQIYSHMDMDLKRTLRDKLGGMAGMYGLDQIIFESFTRCWGFKVTLSASDAAYALGAILEMGVPEKENTVSLSESKELGEEWSKNFYTAMDSLDDIDRLRRGLSTAMDLQKAIVRTGTVLLEKRLIRQLSAFRMAIVKDGPDLAIFTHPQALGKLALWISEAIAEQEKEQFRRHPLPFVIASLDESTDGYLIVGTSVSSSSSHESVPKHPGLNRFGLAFQEVARTSGARVRIDSFEASVVECRKDDFVGFLEGLSLRAALD